jgi:Carboxypeptidase regulatory-like domain/TonB dependent receptor
MKSRALKAIFILWSVCMLSSRSYSQQILGAITGTVTDPTGAAVPDARVKAVNVATNLEVTVKTGQNGSYSIPSLPAGAYKMSFTKEGFKTEEHTEVLVNANRTTTVDSSLVVGTINALVEVTAVPLMNQVDTTSGYVIDNLTIENTPLGTGSFTQLAILSPGVHADFLGGGGVNSGLGNQAIFADGNRDTSNSFSLNGISTNNLFNGNSTSQVGENRFVLNTGETFGAGGVIVTSTSVYAAIGQALPTPPPDAIQEIAVNTSMYDVSQGNNSGAHIGVLTKSGTNLLHGSVYWQYQSSAMNADPFFYNADPAIPLVTTQKPFLNRNQFGTTVGGPIKKDKLFYFLSYQGVRIADAQPSFQTVVVPFSLTNDRSLQGIVNTINSSFLTGCGPGQTPPNPCLDSSQVNSSALALLQAKLPNGQFLIPSANPALSQTSAGQAKAISLGLDSFAIGPNTRSNVDQGIADVDYAVSDKDRLSSKYYVQEDPTSGPFGSDDYLLGFPQQLSAGSQVISIGNTTTLSPNLTWEQHIGFTRLHVYANSGQEFSPSDFGITLLPGASFPNIEISHGDPNFSSGGFQFGPSPSFGNAGMYQNQWEYGTSVNWVKGKHTFSFGAMWDHAQLNIVNNNTKTDTLQFNSFLDFVEGNLHAGDEFAGSASRYYRSNTIGAYAGDNFKLRSNLTLTAGLRWDYDGPLTEKYGKLTAFNPAAYKYIPCTIGGAPADPTTGTACDTGTDVIANSGFEIAGNNSNSLMKARQWAFAPRIGIAWSPLSKLTVRAGYGIFNDRGEFFSYFSPSAGAGFNGPFGVTLAPPFVSAASIAKSATFSNPFGSVSPTSPAGTVAAFTASLPNLQQTACGFPGCWPAGNLFGPALFGGYDVNNKLPYMQNWTFDVQFQASNNWLFDIGYVGNHGTHLVVPIPFNQPLIATSTNPVNGQTSSYGGTTPLFLDTEPVFTNEFSGNAPTRVPYPGYDMNSVLFKAAGTSNYNALQLQAKKRLSHGLQFTASYTYSHALDEQSGLGLFFTGNNPLNLRSNYASADFDQTHVLLINYSYTTPDFVKNAALGRAVNGWTIGGQTVAQSGQPYSVYDFSGSVGSLYYGTSDYITNPIVPIKPGVTPQQAQLQGTTGINAGSPVLNSSDFLPQFVAPGTNGVPGCDASGCDEFESLFGTSGRNLFRGPFQVRFDMSLAKQFPIKERYQVRFEADAFNIFNHPDFDAPNNNVTFFPNFTGPPQIPPAGSLGVIQHTIGSPRFLQLSLHVAF